MDRAYKLRHKRNRESNDISDCEVLSCIKISKIEDDEYKLEQLLNFIKNFFDNLNLEFKKELTNTNYKKEFLNYLQHKKTVKPNLGINQTLTISIYYDIILYASKSLKQHDFSSISFIKLLLICDINEYMVKNFRKLFSNNSEDNLLKLYFYASLLFNPIKMPNSFLSIIICPVTILALDDTNLIHGVNKSDLIYYATSNASLDAYSQLIKNQHLIHYLIGKNKISQTYDLFKLRKKIRSILTEYLQNAKIYSTNLYEGLAGVTIYGLSIVINNSMFKWDNKTVIKAYFITTVLHELSHCLIRLIQREEVELNYLNNTIENINCSESGRIYDSLLLCNNSSFSLKDSLFILDKSNWTLDQKNFQYNYNLTLEKIEKESNKKGKKIIHYTTKQTEKDMPLICSRAYFAKKINYNK